MKLTAMALASAFALSSAGESVAAASSLRQSEPLVHSLRGVTSPHGSAWCRAKLDR